MISFECRTTSSLRMKEVTKRTAVWCKRSKASPTLALFFVLFSICIQRSHKLVQWMRSVERVVVVTKASLETEECCALGEEREHGYAREQLPSSAMTRFKKRLNLLLCGPYLQDEQ
ncbi:hypothetical protein DM01DRAFT_5156 [Hesseltinella vesiculosa]|uniref:Uncharacterized protein n=1 Tax=Hesseltinella vesiculosa TaxID=101127 RepID=A0A1X2GQD2_9FUNG|nr:hypothetical protein DM01DRAFT_5156 [Hesseltinella vesiculosa]